MNKLLATIPTSSISRLSLYRNIGGKSVAEIQRGTGADYVLNGGMWNPDGTPCPLLKIDGKMVSASPWGAWGYAWVTGSDVLMSNETKAYPNFISCTELRNPWDGSAKKLDYPAALGGYRGRSAMAMRGKNLVLYCSQDGSTSVSTPEQLRDELVALGCETAIMLDGGNSSQCDFRGQTVESPERRPVNNLILVHLISSSLDETERFVSAATKELGAPGGAKYVSWYNAYSGSDLPMDSAWCAVFVSWVARQAGIQEGRIPSCSGCTTARNLFRRLGAWHDRTGYTPKRGDIIVFDWDRDPTLLEHIGIVTRVSGGTVYTVEGNSGGGIGTVKEKSYPVQSAQIGGYAEWNASEIATPGDPGEPAVPPAPIVPPDPVAPAVWSVSAVQAELNAKYGLGLAVDGSFGPASQKGLTMAVQKELNKSYDGELAVDGSFGPASRRVCPDLAQGDTGDLVWLLQAALFVRMGYTLDLDGSFGPDCAGKVVRAQKAKRITANGIAGPNTFTALLR